MSDYMAINANDESNPKHIPDEEIIHGEHEDDYEVRCRMAKKNKRTISQRQDSTTVTPENSTINPDSTTLPDPTPALPEEQVVEFNIARIFDKDRTAMRRFVDGEAVTAPSCIDRAKRVIAILRSLGYGSVQEMCATCDTPLIKEGKAIRAIERAAMERVIKVYDNMLDSMGMGEENFKKSDWDAVQAIKSSLGEQGK